MTDIESASPIAASPRIWGAWTTIAWALLVHFLMILIQAVVAFIFIAAMAQGKQSPDRILQIARSLAGDGLYLSVATLTTLLICGPVIIGIVKLKRGSILKDYLGLVAPNWSQVIRWAALTIGFCVAFDLASLSVRRPIVPEFMTTVYASMESRWILWLTLLVAAPLFEELFFRGFLLKGLSESRLRWSGAVFVSSALWTLNHIQYDYYGMLFVFGLGVVLGVARIKTGSIWLTILLHSLVNFAATLEAAVKHHQT